MYIHGDNHISGSLIKKFKMLTPKHKYSLVYI